ncbi:MAG: acyl-CoA dehydrogenase [Actinobacteria bacterium]|nr:acyl-CoA dehydrogenase [Actinomycetota bacterium]MBU1494649.1 acyl-CoA dehydrogenase [Actinomycetota bacterium]
MTHYKTNLRDIEFNLFEMNGLGEILGSGPFAALDTDTARDILREIERLSLEEFSASFEEADRTTLKLVDGEVVLAEGLKKSLDAFYDAGWDRFGLSERFGGVNPPPSLRWAVNELLAGANPAAHLFLSGPMMAELLTKVGTPEQAETWVNAVLDQRWGATMVLTEPDAGSDVGAGITKAHPTDQEGVYHIEGVKRFITSAEADYFANIVHLVLARPDGAVPGTKGLSMFIVPKYLLSEDGSLGERNGVVATNIEHKMGIRGSTTCELTFGMEKPAIGYLVGGVHAGIKQMFEVIEHARMSVAQKAIATLSTGYLNAVEYAKERIQSPDILNTRDPGAPKVAIIKHPDVRRMLMLQKSHVEGLRALVFLASHAQDQAALHPDDPFWAKMSDLLLPMIKGYGPERAFELLQQTMQVFGGSGYTEDYPIEQYIRDVKIDSIYEGTTGIQALDLLFRKIARDQGQTLMRLSGEVLECVKGGGGDDPLAVERELLGKAAEDVQGQLGVMVGAMMASQAEPTELYKPALHANSLMESLAELLMGWQLIRHAEVALAALDGAGDGDRAYYEGKIASARWFAANVLPKAHLRRTLAESEQSTLMSLPDEAF